jgi:hypothetical protein
LFYGFDASFVGEIGPEGLGALSVDSFLPLGPFTRDTPVTGCDDRTFGDVIPPEPLGQLPDDAMSFEVGSSDHYDALILDEGPGGEGVLRRDEDDNLVYQNLDPANRDHVEIIEAACLARGLRFWEKAKTEEPKVPWRDFVRACYIVMGRWTPNLSLRFSSGCTSGMKNFLAELNGPVPSRLDLFVFWMTLYQYQVGEKTGFPSQIRKAFADLYAEFHPEPAPQ